MKDEIFPFNHCHCDSKAFQNYISLQDLPEVHLYSAESVKLPKRHHKKGAFFGDAERHKHYCHADT